MSLQSDVNIGIIDTSTSMILLPESVYDLFTYNVNETIFDCSGAYCYSPKNCSYAVNDTSNFTVYFDGEAYTIPPSGYLMDYYNGQEGCSMLISSLSDSYGMYVLGDTFMRNFYVEFDYKNL